jgi:Na+/proline symporter
LIHPNIPLLLMVLYLLLLFGIAQYAVRRGVAGRSIVSNPYVYSLSLCVYVTAWTFYGSIGRAASSGVEFLPIYLGPLLAMVVGWFLSRKMIRISKEFRLTSLSDFISFRYGRSYAIGAIIAILSLIMVTPYVALQLIAISTSLNVLSGENLLLGMNGTRRLIVALLLGAFAILFGARHLDPMEHHEGLIAVVAFESLVKLGAFLLAGIYVVYGIFGGYGVILEAIASHPTYAGLTDVNYVQWFSLMIISFFAVLLLPRQFHVTVVENVKENHLKKAMWIFPLYMLLINIFVPAIAWGGNLLNTPGLKDAYIISIPFNQGQLLLALLVFIGGVSAATAMILVESVAVGTMLLNDLELPYLLGRIGKGRNLPSLLLNLRRINILLVVFLGYLYSRVVAYDMLADIGIVSFLAVSQLAPVAIGGLYWRKGNRSGAMVGLISGFLLWIYTALMPTIATKGWLYESIIRNGPFGLAYFKPTDLLGLGLDTWTNSLFWTLLFNCSFFWLGSLVSKPSSDEVVLANSFVDVFKEKAEQVPIGKTIRMGTVAELEGALSLYIGESKSKELVDENLLRLNTTRQTIDAAQLLELWNLFEKTLTATVGSSATRIIVEDTIPVEPVIEAEEATLAIYSLQAGRIYEAPEKAYEIFTDQIIHGIEGLCITSLDPEKVRQKWGFKETPIIKLSDERGSDRYISPRNLPLLFMTLRSFVETSRNSVVLIDSLEYLIEKNAKVVPERDVLDFVYQVELLGRKTRLLLAERAEFVHCDLSRDMNEVRELIFVLGPLSAYLFRVFAETMLATLSDSVRAEVVDEADMMITSGSFFGANAAYAEAACEPDMREALGSKSIKFDTGMVLTRREFFLAIRQLARIIKRHDPGFDLASSAGELLKSYGRSPYEILLTPGTTYVIEAESSANGLELFRELITHGMDGLCISRYNPQTLQDKYNIPTDTVIWLTQISEPGFRTVDPTNLPRLSGMISEFLNKANYPLILLEGMGYLITQSNYETVLRFIQSQRDEISLRSAIMFVHIDPLSLDLKELHRLKSELEPLKI